ncbi:MAG: alpha-E domain-containing protein [Verrucomicrobiota bacterium]
MLSRVAESLYWIGRYIERADNIARLLDVNLNILTDFRDLNDSRLIEHWEPIIRSTGDWKLFKSLGYQPDSRSATDFLTFDSENPNSIINCLIAARQNARIIRDQIPSEVFEAINDAYLNLRNSGSKEVWKLGPYQFYQKIQSFSQLFQGLVESIVVRGLGYYFMESGKFLERADKTSRILDIKYHILLPSVDDVGGIVDTAQWTAVLRSCSAFEAYHRNYVKNVDPALVTEFLLFSAKFPRAVRFSLGKVGQNLEMISNNRNVDRFSNEAERECGRLFSDLTYVTLEEIFEQGLHEYLDYLQVRLNAVGDSIHSTYFGAVTED